MKKRELLPFTLDKVTVRFSYFSSRPTTYIILVGYLHHVMYEK